nr:uncharacterized protein LOC129398107 [Pan paniscus]
MSLPHYLHTWGAGTVPGRPSVSLRHPASQLPPPLRLKAGKHPQARAGVPGVGGGKKGSQGRPGRCAPLTLRTGVLPASVLARASARRGAARQNLGARRAGQPEAPLVAGAALRRVWAPGLEEEARGRERGRGGGGGAGAGAWNLQGLDPDTDQIFWNSLSNKRLLQGQNTLPARDPSYSAENGLMAEDGGDGRMKLRGNSNNLGDREWGLGLARGNALDCHSEEDEPGQHQREYLPDGNHINYWQTGAIKSERRCDNYAGKTGVNQEVHSHPVNNSWAFKYNTAIKRQF